MSQPTHGKPKAAGPKLESEASGESDPGPEPRSRREEPHASTLRSRGEEPRASTLRSRAEEPHASTSALRSRAEQPCASPPRDTILIHGVSEDGESFAVLRAREDRLEAGVVRKVKDGESLHGELLRLTPRPESPLLCDVEVQYAPTGASSTGTEAPASASQAPKLTHGGPAQVATSDYRANWDAIWSRPRRQGAPN